MNLFFRMLAVFALVGGFVVGPSGSLFAADVKSLSGYKTYSTLSSFKAFLEENPEVYQQLQNDPALAEEVLGNTARQRAMMQGAVVQAPESVPVQAERPADTLTRDEQATQAANEAIIRALAEKEAANKRAQETLELITQQGALINQARAEAELAATEAKMENIRAAFDGHPEKEAAFFANTALLQKVLDDQLTLEEALAEAGITLKETPEPESTDGPELTETPGPEYIEYPEDQLVHVYGNKYRLGDKEIYDLNHVPSEEEMALDANGWPKFLNVPTECGPANPDVTYFFENRYGYGMGGPGGSASRLLGGAMNKLMDYGLLLHNFRYDVGLTDDEIFAAPFYMPNVSPHMSIHSGDELTATRLAPADHMGVRHGFFAYSVSYCPGDWSNVTPAGKTPLQEGCSRTWGEHPGRKQTRFGYKESLAPEVHNANEKRITCTLEPGERYFYNIAAPHHADPDDLSITEHMIERMKDLARWNPEDYPLSPEENLQNHIDSPGIPDRGGKFVGSAASYGTSAGFISKRPYTPKASPKKRGPGTRYPLKKSEFGNYYELVERGSSRVYETDRGCRVGNTSTKTCYDPHGKLPTIRQTTKCTGPKQITWVEGFNDKAFNHYICFNNNHENLSLVLNRYCLARNEGDFRRVEYKNPRISRLPSTDTIEQCQYDTNRERFDWVTVEAQPSGKDLGGHHNHNRMVISEVAEITPRESCALANKDIQLGDSVQINCPNVTSSNRSDSTFSLNLTCRRVADAPALPVLVNENGFGLNRIPTDPESSSRVHPLLNWLPNCTVE
mgnify:CR=1 FL=1